MSQGAWGKLQAASNVFKSEEEFFGKHDLAVEAAREAKLFALPLTELMKDALIVIRRTRLMQPAALIALGADAHGLQVALFDLWQRKLIEKQLYAPAIAAPDDDQIEVWKLTDLGEARLEKELSK
jgi:hypothetical protein